MFLVGLSSHQLIHCGIFGSGRKHCELHSNLATEN